MPRLSKSFRRLGVQLGYRVAGLPIALRALGAKRHAAGDEVRSAYARQYFRPAKPSEWLHLALALPLAPLIVLLLAFHFTWRNGRAVAASARRPVQLQLIDQIRLYAAAGVLAPWYYSFELYRTPTASHARSFVYRWESKGGVFAIIKRSRRPTSDLHDKIAFAEWCRRSGIPAVPVLARVRRGAIEWLDGDRDRATDWIVKPVAGKGGRGIDRWDRAGDDLFSGPGGRTLQRDALLRQIAAQSRQMPLLIQPRVVNHQDLQPISNGALATTRVLTCLNEEGEPEMIGAVLRMATGRNSVVDNFHAGGIAAAIDISCGRLGRASNIGMDVRLGWLDDHPTTGARISGRVFPFWDQLGAFVEAAHRHFADRALIGWDVAATADGLVMVEANGSPDLDIMQRATLTGLMTGRFAELLAQELWRCASR